MKITSIRCERFSTPFQHVPKYKEYPIILNHSLKQWTDYRYWVASLQISDLRANIKFAKMFDVANITWLELTLIYNSCFQIILHPCVPSNVIENPLSLCHRSKVISLVCSYGPLYPIYRQKYHELQINRGTITQPIIPNDLESPIARA